MRNDLVLHNSASSSGGSGPEGEDEGREDGADEERTKMLPAVSDCEVKIAKKREAMQRNGVVVRGARHSVSSHVVSRRRASSRVITCHR